MFNVEKELKEMKEYLKERTNYEVLRGYKEAKEDYERTENPMIAGALSVIKEEMERRGITEEEFEKEKAIAKAEHDKNQGKQ